MDVHVDAARDDISARRIDDLRAVAGRRGQSRPDRRDRLAPDRDVRPRLSLGTEEDAIGNHDIVIHGDRLPVKPRVSDRTAAASLDRRIGDVRSRGPGHHGPGESDRF